MSRRWKSHQPYEPINLDRVAASHYGTRSRSRSDATVVPTPPDPDVWRQALADAVLALGGGLFVVVAWTALRWALGAV